MTDVQSNGQMGIESISAVTLITGDMARSVGFYLSLGFVLVAGGSQTPFSSFAIGDGFLNLMARPNGPSGWEWGRLIFHVSDVDGLYRQALQLGLVPEASPRDAEWGERYFHVTDPDGHHLSFARPSRP